MSQPTLFTVPDTPIRGEVVTQIGSIVICLSIGCAKRRKTYYIGSCARCGEQASAADVTPQLAAWECLSMCLQTCDRDDCPLTEEEWDAIFDAPETP